MAGEIATAFVTILPSFRGGAASLSSQLGPAAATAGTAAGSKFGGGMLASFKGFVGPMAAVAGGAAVFGFLSSAESDASDLNETVSKAKTIFGDQFTAIDTWSKNAATSLGLPREAALNLVAGFGDMFTQLGFAGDVAATMAEGVATLSADLGSFNNLPTEDVAGRIAGAFRGEYDSLQLLIPNINAARVEQQALGDTGKTSAKDLTAAEKAAAVLAIVNADGAKAAGDFARTSEDNANKQKILSARFTDLKAKIGKGLLPVMGFLFDVGMKIIDFFSSGGDKASVFGTIISKVTDFFKKNRATFESWWESLKAIFDGLKELTAVVVAAILAFWEEHGEKIMHLISVVWDTVKTIIGNALKIIQGVIEVVTGIITGDWGKAWDGVKRIFSAVWDDIKAILKLAWTWITTLIGIQLGAVWSAVTTKFGEIVSWLSELPGRFADAVVALWDWIWIRAGEIKANVIAWFADVGAWIAALPTWFKDKAGEIWAFIWTKAAEIKARAIAALVTFGGWLTTLPAWLEEKAGDVWGWLVDAAARAAAAAWQAIKNQFSGGFGGVLGDDVLGRGGSGVFGGSGFGDSGRVLFGEQDVGGESGRRAAGHQIIVNNPVERNISESLGEAADFLAALA